MNGLARTCTYSCSQARSASGSALVPTDSQAVSDSLSRPRFTENCPFPTIRRGSWPLFGPSPEANATSARRLPEALSMWLATEDRLERIRTGGPRTDTRVLGLGAAVEALLARAPGLSRTNRETMAQVTLVFDDASGTFAGWRPKVMSW